MDNLEAIDILRQNKPTSDPRLCGKELCEAVDIAINALEKEEKYRWKKFPEEEPLEGDERVKEVIMKRVYSNYKIIGHARYALSDAGRGRYWCEENRGWLGHPVWTDHVSGDSSLMVVAWRDVEHPEFIDYDG